MGRPGGTRGRAAVIGLCAAALGPLTACGDGPRPSLEAAVGAAPRPPGNGQKAARAAQRVVWEARGPGGGGALYQPALSPHHAGDLFIATDMSSVFRSTDFGAHWKVLPFGQLRGDSGTAVRFTDDPKVLYALSAADDGGRLVKSIDGGSDWHAGVVDPSPGRLRALLVPGGVGQRVVVADGRALFASLDGGGHFREVHRSPRRQGLVVAGAHAHGAAILVGTSDGVLSSRDGGATFTIEPPDGIDPGEAIVSFAGATTPDGRTHLYAVTFAADAVVPGVTAGELDAFAGLYAREPGQPWTRRGADSAARHRLSLVAAAGNDAVAYAAGGDRAGSTPVVHRTDDGGATWRLVLHTAGNGNVATGWMGEGGAKGWDFGEYALGLAVRPGDSSRVALTDLGAVHVSSDGGASWRQAYSEADAQTPAGRRTPASRRSQGNGVDPTSVWGLAFTGPGRLFACYTDIAGAFSDDGGESWTRGGDSGLRLNTTYHAVVAASGEVFAATSSVHDLYQSGYLTDDRIDGPPGRPARGDILRSGDHGAHFQPLSPTPIGHPVVSLALDDQAHVLYASVVHSRAGGIHRVALGGPALPSQLPAPPRTQGHPYTVHLLRDGSILASYAARREGNRRRRGAFTASAGVFLLPGAAAAWLDRSDPAMRFHTRDVIVDPTDPDENTWFAGVFSVADDRAGGLYRTVDRGRSWRRISPPLNVESATVASDGRGAWFTTEAEGLWHTDDVRAAWPRWLPVEEYPFSHPLRLVLDPADPSRAWATSFGGGLRLLARPR